MSPPLKPLHADTWYGRLDLDELRREVQYIYEIMGAAGLTPPGAPVTPTPTPSASLYAGDTVGFAGDTVGLVGTGV